jgi:hypothetical protein
LGPQKDPFNQVAAQQGFRCAHVKMQNNHSLEKAFAGLSCGAAGVPLRHYTCDMNHQISKK